MAKPRFGVARLIGRWLGRIVSKRLSKGNFEMADNNLVALALADGLLPDGLLPGPSREDTIAQLLAYADEVDKADSGQLSPLSEWWHRAGSGQLPPLSALWPAFLESLDRRFVQPAINGVLAPSRALKGEYSDGLYLYPDGVVRPYSPAMYDAAADMAGLVGLRGVVPMGQSAANQLTSLASQSARIYDTPSVPQRPFEADYPFGAQVDEAGRLTHDIDGNPLNPDARWVVGREVVGGPDRPFPQAELDALTEALTGSGPQGVAPRQLQGDAGRYIREQDPLTGDTVRSILFDRTLPTETGQRVLAHELGHAIDEAARQVPTEGLNTPLRAIYNDLNNPQTYGRPFGPEQAGYNQPFVQRELMAEALRAYLADPNYIKATAPEVAVRIRQHVNQNPQLRSVIQFNAGGVPLPAQPAQSEWSEWVPGYNTLGVIPAKAGIQP